MCASCGCSTVNDQVNVNAHVHDHGGGPVHDRDHVHVRRAVSLEEAVLAKNDGVATENRGFLESLGIAAFNFVSSPWAGKTSLLVALIGELGERLKIGVIEGDQETSRDAERIRVTGFKRSRSVVMSVTEGEDKPLKYPHMFRAARVLVLTL